MHLHIYFGTMTGTAQRMTCPQAASASHHLGQWDALIHLTDGWSEVAQSCPTLCYPMDCSLPGSSVHGIFQARVLEWVAIPSPGYLPDPGIEPGSPGLQADALPSEPPGKPTASFLLSSYTALFFFLAVITIWHHIIVNMCTVHLCEILQEQGSVSIVSSTLPTMPNT